MALTQVPTIVIASLAKQSSTDDYQVERLLRQARNDGMSGLTRCYSVKTLIPDDPIDANC